MGSSYPKTLEHRNDLYSAALLYFMCCITKHFSFLIFHSSEACKRNQMATRPMGDPRALYFFEKMRYTIKHHLWRCSQALRRGACKPLIPVFNSGHRLQPFHSCIRRSFLMQKRAVFEKSKTARFTYHVTE